MVTTKSGTYNNIMVDYLNNMLKSGLKGGTPLLSTPNTVHVCGAEFRLHVHNITKAVVVLTRPRRIKPINVLIQGCSL